MKRKEPASKSVYRAILPVQKQRDEQSGLLLVNRYFVPECEPAERRILWMLVDWLALSCLGCGLLMMAVTGFSIQIPVWFIFSMLGMSAGVVLLYNLKLRKSFIFAAAFLIILGYLAALFLNQDSFLRGAGQLANSIITSLNETYSGQIAPVSNTVGTQNAAVFLSFIAWPLLLAIGAALLKSDQMLLINIIVFPLLVLLCLCGAAKDAFSLFIVLFGVMLSMSFSTQRRQYRMWGGDNHELWEKNHRRFQNVQKKTAIIILAASIVLTVPGFLMVRPLLGFALRPAEEYSTQVQSGILNRLLKFLPEISAGRVSLNLEAMGGGVQDGSLDSESGYLLEGVEDLQLTVSSKPKEALFLKGFIGTEYSEGSWKQGYGNTFDGAAMNWNTEGSARIYINNLPFLRTAFAITQQGPDSTFVNLEPSQILVTRLNANESYTYVPYGAFLNSYYEIEAGDGAVKGQTDQEDRLLFFFREDIDNVLDAWNETEDTASVLDRVEESYRAFCDNGCLKVSVLDSMAEEIRNVKTENRWDPRTDTEEISTWIRAFLAEDYSYSLINDIPEGADPLEYFFFTSKTGNSVHYASAAVMLYRLFGVPARYVVGYEIPSSLFSAQTGGVYTATVQGDNSQAWAEIYVPGKGWTPKDMTPGVIGTYEEVGPGGEKIESVVAPGESPEPEEEKQTENNEDDQKINVIDESLLAPGKTDLQQMIRYIVTAISVVVISAGGFMLCRFCCIKLGYPFPGRKKTDVRMLGLFRTYFRRMQRLGMPETITSQSPKFAEFCDEQLRCRAPELEGKTGTVVEHIYLASYGPGKYTEADIRMLRRLYFASFRRVKKK